MRRWNQRNKPPPGTLVRCLVPIGRGVWMYGEVIDPEHVPLVQDDCTTRETRDRMRYLAVRTDAVLVHWKVEENAGAIDKLTYMSVDSLDPADVIDMMGALEA